MTISTGNGYITTSDFKEILKEIEPDISEKDLTGMINEIDVDDSGTVDFEGLLKLNNKKKLNVTRYSYKLSHKRRYFNYSKNEQICFIVKMVF